MDESPITREVLGMSEPSSPRTYAFDLARITTERIMKYVLADLNIDSTVRRQRIEVEIRRSLMLMATETADRLGYDRDFFEDLPS